MPRPRKKETSWSRLQRGELSDSRIRFEAIHLYRHNRKASRNVNTKLTITCLTIIAESFLELLACKKYTTFDGAEWEVHVLGNLIIFIAGDVH